jgi:hypothetical protein
VIWKWLFSHDATALESICSTRDHPAGCLIVFQQTCVNVDIFPTQQSMRFQHMHVTVSRRFNFTSSSDLLPITFAWLHVHLRQVYFSTLFPNSIARPKRLHCCTTRHESMAKTIIHILFFDAHNHLRFSPCILSFHLWWMVIWPDSLECVRSTTPTELHDRVLFFWFRHVLARLSRETAISYHFPYVTTPFCHSHPFQDSSVKEWQSWPHKYSRPNLHPVLVHVSPKRP